MGQTNEFQPQGDHTIELDAQTLGEGTYYLRLNAGTGLGLVKMTKIVY